MVAKKKMPTPHTHFAMTTKLQAIMLAQDKGLALIRDNMHLWAIRKRDKAHLYMGFCPSYFSVWGMACNLMQEPDFDPDLLPFQTEADDPKASSIKLFNPRTGKAFKMSKKDMRQSRRGVPRDKKTRGKTLRRSG